MQLIFLGVALAGTPVIYEGDAAAAIAAVSASTGVPQWELRPLGLAELFPGEGTLVLGYAQPAGCAAAPSTNAAVRELVTAAEKRLNKQEWSEMRDRLAAGAAVLPCLGEPAEASLMSRLFFLDGFAAGELGDQAGATLAFRRARASQPGLAWDERLVGASRAAFDSVSTSPPAEGAVVLGPGFDNAATLWVDGRLAPVENGAVKLGEGQHVVQMLQPSVSTWAVTVKGKNPVALVSAPAARAQALVGAGTEAGRAVLEAATERVLGADAEVWVWTGSALWHGGATWASSPVKVPARAPAPRSPLGPALVGAGSALVGLGVAGAVVGWTEADAHFGAVPQETDQTYEIRNAWYHSSVTLGTVSTVAAAVGVVGIVAGVVAAGHPADAPAWGFAPAPGGGNLFVTGGF